MKNTSCGFIGSSFVNNQYEEYGIKAIPILSYEKNVSFGYVNRRRDSLSNLAKSLILYFDNLEMDKN